MVSGSLLDLLDGGDASGLVDGIIDRLKGFASVPTVLERAAFLWVWKRDWQAKHPENHRGGDRKSLKYLENINAQSLRFDIEASAATGLQKRSIETDIALAEKLGPQSIRALWVSPIADNGAALRAVAKLDSTGRAALYAAWTVKPSLGFALAMREAKLRQDVDSEQEAFSRLLDGWTRAGSKARRRFLAEIGCDETAAAKLIAAWRKRGGEQ